MNNASEDKVDSEELKRGEGEKKRSELRSESHESKVWGSVKGI